MLSWAWRKDMEKILLMGRDEVFRYALHNKVFEEQKIPPPYIVDNWRGAELKMICLASLIDGMCNQLSQYDED